VTDGAHVPHPAEDRQACERIADGLVGRLEGARDSASIGPAVVRVWGEIESVLSPILGRRGAAALYNRSLHLSSSAHAWLAGLQPGPLAEIDFESLETVFADEANPEAFAAAQAMLQTFCSLLVGLVGVSLTEHLLRPVVLHMQSESPPRAP
jgi:hypothetical protein